MNELIDHTLLKPEATKEQILKLCEEAKQYAFASVCVNSYWVSTCKKALQGSDVNICCVVGFPLGAMSAKAKAFECKTAIEDGAKEIDMVLNIGELLAGNDEAVKEDIRTVLKAANNHLVKVIFETCLLRDEQIVKACELCVEVGAPYVKTSTGFNAAGANPHVVKLMKETVKDKALVKAAGGIRSLADAKEMILAGASRFGTSSGVALMQGVKTNKDAY